MTHSLFKLLDKASLITLPGGDELIYNRTLRAFGIKGREYTARGGIEAFIFVDQDVTLVEGEVVAYYYPGLDSTPQERRIHLHKWAPLTSDDVSKG